MIYINHINVFIVLERHGYKEHFSFVYFLYYYIILTYFFTINKVVLKRQNTDRNAKNTDRKNIDRNAKKTIPK